MKTETSPTPVIEKVATPQPAPTLDKGTAPKVSESAPEITEPNDTFTSIDEKTLSPEVKVKYDSMLTDYKKKTTEVANQRREVEAKLKEVQDVLQNPDFQRVYSQMNSGQQAQVQQESGITEEEFNKAFENKDNFAGFIQKVAKVSTAQSQAEITNLKASLMIKDFKGSHPEFEKLNKYGFITKQLETDRRAHGNDEKQWTQALNEAYSNADRVYREISEEGRREGLKIIEQKVQASTEPPTNTSAPENPFGDPKNWTTAQAIEAARRGYKVK